VRYLKILVRSFVDFFKDGGLMLAGSISYFSIMALVPLCLFLTTVLGYILGHYHNFYAFFSARLISLFPDITKGITKELGKLISFRGIGSFSIVLYALLSFQVFSSMESALNKIFEVKKNRSFFLSVILSLTMVTLLIILILVSFIATSLVPVLGALRRVFPGLGIGILTAFVIRYVIPFFMVLLAITGMYIFFPKIKVRFPDAFAGAIFAALFLEIAKHIFTLYVSTAIRFGTIYGPLTAFVVFLLWVFYSSCILLIGAEIVHNLMINKKGR
jgi:membrane protein